MTPTEKSLKMLRAQGGLVEKVEHWNSFARRRQDLFGFGDIVHVLGDTVIIVQTTSATNVSARVNKIAKSPVAREWLRPPTRAIHVHGWKRGDTRNPRIVIITPETFSAVNPKPTTDEKDSILTQHTDPVCVPSAN